MVSPFESTATFRAYITGLAVSILTMVILKCGWMLLKKFTVKVMLRLDDIGGFAQQMQARSRRSVLSRTGSLSTITAEPDPQHKVYVVCIVMHDKNMY